MPAEGKLYVVATPIGNLEDISPRAARILGEVDLVAAEDTRVSGRLLKHLGVRSRMISYREENERTVAGKLLSSLQAGESIALVSDAGTPGVSDPGYRLVKAAADAGIELVAVAGPSAAVALLSVSGLPTDRFSFEGFAPNKAVARRKILGGLRGAGRTVIWYESPRRVIAFLEDVASELDDPLVAVGRELTKMYEEVLRGRASEVVQRLREQGPRGEFTVAAYVGADSGEVLEGDALLERVASLLDDGSSVKEAAAELKAAGVPRRAVYEAARQLKG